MAINAWILYQIEIHRGQACSDDPEFLSRPTGQVDDPAFDIGSPVVDSNRDMTAIVFVYHSDITPEGERLVCGRQCIHIIDLAIRRSCAVVIRPVPACNPRFNKFTAAIQNIAGEEWDSEQKKQEDSNRTVL